MINTKTKGELGRRIEYDVEHDLFHPQNVYSDEYITPTFIEYVQKLEQENAELEAEVKEWKDKADLWCKTANLKDHNIMINKELEQENAELKDDNKVMADNYSKMEQKFYNNLTKAKEHIQTLISCLIDWVQEGDKDYCHIAEAEQFLNENSTYERIQKAKYNYTD